MLEEKYGGLMEQGGHISFTANPDFTREGKAVDDFLHPEVIVFGTTDSTLHKFAFDLYPKQEKKYALVDAHTAELIKYTNNAFHALKISFANEIGRIATSYHIDAKLVMNALCKDTRLNMSSAYLKPGFAFGGSCLPKDLRGLSKISSQNGISTSLIDSVLQSNEEHIKYYAKQLALKVTGTVGFVGLGFKDDVFDLRESPVIYLMNELIAKHKKVFFYEKDLEKILSIKSNVVFLNKVFPNWKKYFVNSEEVLRENCEKVFRNGGDLNDLSFLSLSISKVLSL